jgi:hypothetical protein
VKAIFGWAKRESSTQRLNCCSAVVRELVSSTHTLLAYAHASFLSAPTCSSQARFSSNAGPAEASQLQSSASYHSLQSMQFLRRHKVSWRVANCKAIKRLRTSKARLRQSTQQGSREEEAVRFSALLLLLAHVSFFFSCLVQAGFASSGRSGERRCSGPKHLRQV